MKWKELKGKGRIKKILVVDDEKVICDMLSEFLAKKGYKVFTALNGKDALKLVKRQKPQLVFLDVRMPDMDGVEVLQRIKKFNKKIHVIIATVASNGDTSARCIGLGAFDYITKPISLEYLENVIEAASLGFKQK